MPHHRVLKENPNRTLREALSGNPEVTAGRQTCAFRKTPSQRFGNNPPPLNPKEYPMGVLKV